MKKNFHPKMSTLTVELTDGTKYDVTWTGDKSSIKTNMDPLNHPAWTGDFGLNINKGRAAKFKGRFK